MTTDDMVLEIGGIGEMPPTEAAARAREDRKLRAVAHNYRRPLLRRAMRTAARAGRAAASLTETAGKSLVSSAAGIAAASLLVAAVVGLRMATGQPLEGTAENINEMLLGDLDEKARGAASARDELEGNAGLMRAYAAGGSRGQIVDVAKNLARMNTQRERGASNIRRAFPNNERLDLIILAAQSALVAAWEGNGGPAHVTKLTRVYQQTRRDKE